MTGVAREIEPRPEVAATYDRLFEAYVALYPATAPVLGQLTGPGGGGPA
jgi:sugar (pentulose or hexulose) kinase